jgi:hypothetical protein
VVKKYTVNFRLKPVFYLDQDLAVER